MKNPLCLLLCHLSVVCLLVFLAIPMYAKPSLKSDLLKHVTPGKPSKLYSLGKKLGSGSNGAVYQSRDKNHAMVAIKIFPLKSSGDFAKAINEAEIYTSKISQLDRPDLFVKFHKMYYQDGKAWIVMSKVDGHKISEISSRKVTIPVVKGILYQTLTALSLLQKAGVCHSDLDQSNIMIDSKRKNLILIDFGLAKHLKKGSVKSSDKFKFTSKCSDLRKYAAFVDTMVDRLRKSDRGHFSKFVKFLRNLPSKKTSWDALLQDPIFQDVSKTNYIPV